MSEKTELIEATTVVNEADGNVEGQIEIKSEKEESLQETPVEESAVVPEEKKTTKQLEFTSLKENNEDIKRKILPFKMLKRISKIH